MCGEVLQKIVRAIESEVHAGAHQNDATPGPTCLDILFVSLRLSTIDLVGLETKWI